jgi:hypothetical protein
MIQEYWRDIYFFFQKLPIFFGEFLGDFQYSPTPTNLSKVAIDYGNIFKEVVPINMPRCNLLAIALKNLRITDDRF